MTIARAGILSALFLVLTGFGCSRIVEFQAPPLTYGPTAKLDIKVLLQLSEELRTTRFERTQPPEVIVPLGQPLARNSEALARALFSDVVIMHNLSAPQDSDADAVLIPRLLSITHTRPLFTFQEQQTTMVFEWTMKQRNGDVVWADTITVSDKATLGGVTAGSKARDHVEAMVAQLYRRSFEAMSSSPQIKELSVSRRRELPR